MCVYETNNKQKVPKNSPPFRGVDLIRKRTVHKRKINLIELHGSCCLNEIQHAVKFILLLVIYVVCAAQHHQRQIKSEWRDSHLFNTILIVVRCCFDRWASIRKQRVWIKAMKERTLANATPKSNYIIVRKALKQLTNWRKSLIFVSYCALRYCRCKSFLCEWVCVVMVAICRCMSHSLKWWCTWIQFSFSSVNYLAFFAFAFHCIRFCSNAI